LEKIRAELEVDFLRIARSEEVEICRYRLLPPKTRRSTIGAIGNAWVKYQMLFSSIYDAVKQQGPVKGRTSKQVSSETDFGFEYTFAGSVGVVMTLPASGMTYSRTHDLDAASALLFEMSKSQTPEQLRLFVPRVGVPPLNKFSSWVDAHVIFGAGAGIDWLGPVEGSLIVQIEEFKVLKDALHKTTEPVETEEIISGMLRGVSLERNRFEMRLPSGELLEGNIGDANITERQRAELPKKYSARIRITRTIDIATEKEDVDYSLDELLKELEI
jgi:hypothetical protein